MLVNDSLSYKVGIWIYDTKSAITLLKSSKPSLLNNVFISPNNKESSGFAYILAIIFLFNAKSILT